jgi:transcription factor 1
VNPGVGLWSSKLHDAIKPRTHILMEPDTDLYLPFLQHLLEKENSTYKLIPESGIIWSSLDKLGTENHLPHQEILSKGDARLEKANDTLLFIANLGYYPSKAYRGFPSVTTLMIHQLLSAVRAHSIFQGYGLVRMLIWMRDRDKNAIFPRVISQRKKFSVEAEVTCENIFEVAGSDELSSIYRREHAIDLEGARNVLDRMKSANVKTPEHRIGSLQNEAAQNLHQAKDTDAGVIRPFQEELKEMEERYARQEFCSYYDKTGKPVYINDAKRSAMNSGTPEWTRLLQLRWRLNQANSNADKLNSFLDEYDEIATARARLQGADTVEAKAELDALHERQMKWQDGVERLTGSNGASLWIRLDDRRAFRQDPPILLWDRREAEPLKVVSDDFFPQQEMCLLDFHPRSVWPVFQGKKFANYDYFEFMLTALYTNPTLSVVRGLKALAPGAAEWIIPRCPSLTDTTKGGVVDLEHLSVRTLNQDMLREMIEAWMDWPFRPTKAEMLVRTDGRRSWSGDDDDLETTVPGFS